MTANSQGDTLHRGVDEKYFCLDDISSTNEKIPCRFEVSALHLGYLDPSCDSEHIPTGAKFELPLWLAKAVCSRKKHFVTIDLPKQYKEGYREILGADATVVDLHKLGPYFYTFGTQLLHFEHPESLDISKVLLQAFQNRFRKIMDSSQNSYNEDVTQLTGKLDVCERNVFMMGQQGLNDFMRWETRQTEKLTISLMVENHKKRKRAQMDDN